MCRCNHNRIIELFAESHADLITEKGFQFATDHDENCAIHQGFCCNCLPNVIMHVESGSFLLDPYGETHYLQ